MFYFLEKPTVGEVEGKLELLSVPVVRNILDLYSSLWAFTKMFSFVLVGLSLVPDVFSMTLCGTKGMVKVEKGKKTNQYVCSGLTPNIGVEWLIHLSGKLETIGVCDPYPESGDAGVCQIRILKDIFILERSPLNSTLTVNDQIPMSKIVFTDGLLCRAINTSAGTVPQTASCNTDFISANEVNRTTILIAAITGSTLVLLFGVALLALMIRRYRGQRRREETGPGETRNETETGEAIIENCLYVTSSNDNETNEENHYAEIEEPEEENSRESTMHNQLQ